MGIGPWSQEQIDAARSVRFSTVMDFIGAYYKLDADYVPLIPGRRSKRVHLSYQGRDFRFIFTGEKFVNDLLPDGTPGRGGGGTIDFVRHVVDCNFVQAVKICLDAVNSTGSGGER